MPIPPLASAQTPYGPQVSFRTEGVLPPAVVYVSPQDSIYIQFFSPSLAAPVNVNYRLLTPQGLLISNQQATTTTVGAGVTGNIVIPPAEGYLLSLSVQCPTAVRGQMFVQAFLLSGPNTATGVLDQLLLQGFASGYDVVAYPQSRPESSTSGRGYLHSVGIAPPGAGKEWTITVPPGVRWIIKSIQTSIVTGVGGARIPNISIVNPAFQAVAFFPPINAVPASSAVNLEWYDGAPFANANQYLLTPLIRDLVIGPGWIVGSNTFNLGAGDVYNETVLFVEEWPSAN